MYWTAGIFHVINGQNFYSILVYKRSHLTTSSVFLRNNGAPTYLKPRSVQFFFFYKKNLLHFCPNRNTKMIKETCFVLYCHS